MIRKSYTFGCPVCRKSFTYDEPGEPACTGPSEMRDEHPLAIMVLERVNELRVDPVVAQARADGPLILHAR